MTFLPISHARIKLQKRHLLEWDTLALEQQTVLLLVRGEYVKKLASCPADSMAFVETRAQQAMHLMKLISQQQQERQQLRSRHQQEEVVLEQTIAT